jgi:hypothetical protein
MKDTTSVEEKISEFEKEWMIGSYQKRNGERVPYIEFYGWLRTALLEAHTAGASAMLQRVREIGIKMVTDLDKRYEDTIDREYAYGSMFIGKLLDTLQKEIEGTITPSEEKA